MSFEHKQMKMTELTGMGGGYTRTEWSQVLFKLIPPRWRRRTRPHFRHGRPHPHPRDPPSSPPGRSQVWSLTQFYSVDFSKSKDVKKCVFIKRKIKDYVSCCWQCPGTSTPSAAHLTVSLYLYSSGSNARGESRSLKGCCVSSKENSVSLTRGHWCALQANQWFFTRKETEKNWVNGQTWS